MTLPLGPVAKEYLALKAENERLRSALVAVETDTEEDGIREFVREVLAVERRLAFDEEDRG
jgi:hypothetical protein